MAMVGTLEATDGRHGLLIDEFTDESLKSF